MTYWWIIRKYRFDAQQWKVIGIKDVPSLLSISRIHVSAAYGDTLWRWEGCAGGEYAWVALHYITGGAGISTQQWRHYGVVSIENGFMSVMISTIREVRSAEDNQSAAAVRSWDLLYQLTERRIAEEWGFDGLLVTVWHRSSSRTW